MKISKRAEQKNFTLDTHFYTQDEIENLVNKGIVDYLYNAYRVYTRHCTEVKVVVVNGMYCTVAVHQGGLQLHIEL